MFRIGTESEYAKWFVYVLWMSAERLSHCTLFFGASSSLRMFRDEQLMIWDRCTRTLVTGLAGIDVVGLPGLGPRYIPK